MIEALAAVVALVLTGGSWWAAGAAAALAYLGTCLWWPFGFCVRCRGKGKLFRSNGKAFRDCGWCAGKGRRFRVGAVLLVRGRNRSR